MDHAEMRGDERWPGLILVSMTGMAVQLKNLEIRGEQRIKDMSALFEKAGFLQKNEALREEYQRRSKK